MYCVLYIVYCASRTAYRMMYDVDLIVDEKNAEECIQYFDGHRPLLAFDMTDIALHYCYLLHAVFIRSMTRLSLYRTARGKAANYIGVLACLFLNSLLRNPVL